MELFSKTPGAKAISTNVNTSSGSDDRSASSCESKAHAEALRPAKLPRFVPSNRGYFTADTAVVSSTPGISVRPSALGARPTARTASGMGGGGGFSSMISKAREVGTTSPTDDGERGRTRSSSPPTTTPVQQRPLLSGVFSGVASSGSQPSTLSSFSTTNSASESGMPGGASGFGRFKNTATAGATTTHGKGRPFGGGPVSTLAEDGTAMGSISSSSSTFGNAAAKQPDAEPRRTPPMGSKARGVAAELADAGRDVAQNDIFRNVSSAKDDGSSDKNKDDTPNRGVRSDDSADLGRLATERSARRDSSPMDEGRSIGETNYQSHDKSGDNRQVVIAAGGGSFDTPSLGSRSRHRPQFPGSFVGVQRPLAPSQHHQQQHEQQHQQQRQQRPSAASVYRQPSLAGGGATSCVNNEARPSPSGEQQNMFRCRDGEVAPLRVSRDDFGQRPPSPRAASSSEQSRISTVDDGSSKVNRPNALELDDENDEAEETRAKMVQRQEWIRQKDAATAGFRRECEAEVEHMKALMEKYISELEAMLDSDLVDALDDNLGQKMDDNHKEKFRVRKVTSVVSEFFADPRVPKAQRSV